jgi:enterochelin esterase-like enzyme
MDLPVKDGVFQPAIQAKWAANRPLITLDQYIDNLKKLKGIAFDAGTRDQGIAASIKVLDEELNKYNVKHTFELYEGDHINRIAERIETKMLRFFSDNLSVGK